MKKVLLFNTFLCACALGLHSQNIQLFNDFHASFAKRDWKKLESMLSYDFTLIDWNGKTVDRKDEYVTYLRDWGGTMGTTWTVFNSEEKDKKVYSTEQDFDPFMSAFYGVAPIFSFTYEFKENQIWKIKYDTLNGYHLDEQKFNMNYNSFILFVKTKYPNELSNLVGNDRKKSAQSHLKMIKLWEKEK